MEKLKYIRVFGFSHPLHDAMLVRQLIEQLKQFDAEESICLVDYEMQRDYNIEVVKREKGYNCIFIREIPTYNFDNVIIH